MLKRISLTSALLLTFWSPLVVADEFRIRPHIQNISQTGATLIWETTEESKGSISYGKASGSLDGQIAATDSGTIHRVRIEGLDADNAYTYRIQAGDDVQEAKFTTAPDDEREITFVVVGDPRRWGTYWKDSGMDEHVKQWNADLYLTMGDLVVDGHQYEQWPEHFQRFEDLTDSKWFVTARGNHEGSQIRDTQNDWFAKYHELPGGEPYAAFDWGNTHFVLISYESTGRKKDWTKSAEWLDGHLDSVNKKYTVVAHHFPVYCTGYDGWDLSRKEPGVNAEEFRKVLDKHNVPLNCTGHTHIYERHYPLRNDRRDDLNGTHYVVNGGDINANYPDWWTAVSDDKATMSKPTYTVFQAKQDRIISRTFAWSKLDKSIIEIDYFIIWKDESIPKGVLSSLDGKSGAGLVESIGDLGALIYAPAAEALLPYLDSDDETVRHAAAKSISIIANADVADDVLKHLHHADPKVSAYMARALEVAPSKRAIRSLKKELLEGELSDDARFHLIGALQFHGNEKDAASAAIEILSEYGASPKLRRRAAYALNQTAAKRNAKDMIEIVRKEADRYVTMTVGYSLNKITGNRVSLADRAPLATSEPGQRRELIETWLPN